MIELKALGVAVCLLGLAGLFLPVIPGSALVFVGIVLVAWADGFARIGFGTLAAVGVLAVAAALVDNLAGAIGARKLGASKWGVLGALVGLVAGLAMGPLGVVIGPAAGALVAEYLVDRDFKRASKAGAGAVIGFLVGLVAKIALAFSMIGIAVLAYWK